MISVVGLAILFLIVLAVIGLPMARLSKSVTIGGRTVSGNITRTGEGEISHRVTLAAGKAGTLTTRTDNDTGTLTLGASHGITDGQIVDVYWGGATPGVHRGMTVGTVAGTSVPVDGGTGDNLPAAATAIVACVQTTIDVDFEGDDADMVAVSATRRCSVHFQQAAGTSIKALDLGKSGNDGEIWDWSSDSDVTNPFAGVTVGQAKVSNGDGANTCQVDIGAVLDTVA